jgi:hypothetical protein
VDAGCDREEEEEEEEDADNSNRRAVQLGSPSVHTSIAGFSELMNHFSEKPWVSTRESSTIGLAV